MLDELLAASIARVPAFRGVNGKLMVVIEEPVDGLHLLDAANVNPVDAAGVEAGLKAPPAREPSPPEVRTVELANPIHVAIEIERHVRFMRVRKDSKETVYVRADPPVCDAINGGKVKSLLPRVKGVQTLPLVLRRRDGSFEIVMNEGVDRRLGFYMRVDPALRAILPDPSKITLADVTAAYGFYDEWLVDVDGDATAKAVLVDPADDDPADDALAGAPRLHGQRGVAGRGQDDGHSHDHACGARAARGGGGMGGARGRNPQGDVRLSRSAGNAAAGLGQHQARLPDHQLDGGTRSHQRVHFGSHPRAERRERERPGAHGAGVDGKRHRPEGRNVEPLHCRDLARLAARPRQTVLSPIPTRSNGPSITGWRSSRRCTRSCARRAPSRMGARHG